MRHYWPRAHHGVVKADQFEHSMYGTMTKVDVRLDCGLIGKITSDHFPKEWRQGGIKAEPLPFDQLQEVARPGETIVCIIDRVDYQRFRVDLNGTSEVVLEKLGASDGVFSLQIHYLCI